MLSNQNGVLFWKAIIGDNADFVSYEDGLIPGNDENIVSGGIIYSSPCLYLYGNNVTLEIERAKNDCERSLPRDQHCYIIAVPPSKD